MSFTICRTVADMRAHVRDWRSAGETVALVPTMGALHEGHMALVRAAKTRASRVIATIFVNPIQFNNAQDLQTYPRTEETDAEKLAGEGVDMLYAPSADEMYPEGFSTSVSVLGVSEGLCGAFRPGHFDGVATVVAKLFLQSGADMAFFGEKDYQQLAVIGRMARDLDIDISIHGVPTVREADGLALSSRNARLSAAGRAKAPVLARTLFDTASRLADGANPTHLLEKTRHDLLGAGFSEVEYLEMRHADTLAPLERPDGPARLFVAAWIDGVRLIDNVPIGD